jgi:putative ATP-dependent endonuclease of the OLD family
MRVAHLSIRNFRGIKEGEVSLREHTVVIGTNNCGKTTVIEALALLFGRDRLVRDLTEHDFYGSTPQPQDRIHIVGTLAGFEPNDPDRHPDWFRAGRGVPKWLAPSSSEVTPAFREGSELCVQVAVSARFDIDSLSAEIVRYFYDSEHQEDPFAGEPATFVTTTLLRDVGFFLVPASRTWDRTISFSSELFRRLVAATAGLPSEALLSERDRLRSPQAPLEEAAGFKNLVTGVNAQLAGLFSAPPVLGFRVTSTDSASLLEAITPHYTSPSGPTLPSKRQGSGLIALQNLLLLLEFGRLRHGDNRSFLLAIEEPELHTPPYLQQRVLTKVRATCSQSITTTHSPLVASQFDTHDILLFRNDHGILTSESLTPRGLTATAPNAIRKLLTLNRLETISAIMHECIMVPEGRTDYELLRLLARVVDLHQESYPTSPEDISFSTFVGLIPTHDGSVVATARTLSGVHGHIAALVDGDEAGRGYTAQLLALPRPPRVIRWPHDHSLEHIIQWIAMDNEPTLIADAFTILELSPVDGTDLYTLLSASTSAGGRKGDNIFYEALVAAVGANPTCLDRARLLLVSLTKAMLGLTQELFKPLTTEDVLVFQP